MQRIFVLISALICFHNALAIDSVPKSSNKFISNSIMTALMYTSLPIVASYATGVDENGLFDLCPPHNSPLPAPCVSSQDDHPPVFLPPWEYDGTLERMKDKLLVYVSSLPNAELVTNSDRYLRFRFADPADKNKIDDTEFYFTPSDSIIQFRSCRRGEIISDFGMNKKRIEQIRLALRLVPIAVL